jgi:hypothetical protein
MAIEVELRIWCLNFIRGVTMSQPQAQSQSLLAEMNFSNALPSAAVARPAGNGPRVANPVDAPIASPVHSLQDKLIGFDELDAGSEMAYSFKAHKAPAWVRMALPVVLSIGLWAGILYAVGLIG